MLRVLLALLVCQGGLVVSSQAAILGITRIGQGTVSPDVGVYSTWWGARVTLRATPAPGWAVDHWEGDVTGTGAAKTVYMFSDRRVTVVFRPLVPSPANALERYVGAWDPSFQWSLYDLDRHFGWSKHTIRMQSQQWRSFSEVDRPFWIHDVGIIQPWFAKNECVLLVDGGSNPGTAPPEEASSDIAAVAALYGLVYAEVSDVPNQPLAFADEGGTQRSEDAILAYSLDKYLVTGDFRWPVHVAMTKAVVRAMDTIQDRLPRIGRFLVAGGSKRAWTSWLTAAVDPRVVGLASLSFDTANFAENTRHHFEALGFYTPAVQDYVDFDLFCRVNSPAGDDLLKIVDPYAYFPRYAMLPKLLENSAGDQFFLPDSSRFYLSDLPGPFWLRYTVNTDHSQMQDTTAITTALQWVDKVLDGDPLPRFGWTFEPDGSIRVQTYTWPRAVRLWQATNPAARDFRLERIGPAWTSSLLAHQGGGVFVGYVAPPDTGFTAFLVELDFGEGILLTTEVRVTPDVLPFAGMACP